jgi:hypothetical protein
MNKKTHVVLDPLKSKLLIDCKRKVSITKQPS